MKTTNSLKVKSVLAILLVVGELVAQLVFAPTNALAAQAAEPALALPAGITLTGQMTQDDAAYLLDSLQYLRDQLPQWWQDAMDARPFTLTLDATMTDKGRVAIAECCDAQGYGLVKFGYHFGKFTVSNDPDSQTVEARRVTFLGILIHELTHVRDQREGRFTAKTDRKSCIAAESSGLTQQLQVKRDLATRLADDPSADSVFQSWLDQQVRTETSDLRSRELWDLYCGAFES
jgi:hypothetical protein